MAYRIRDLIFTFVPRGLGEDGSGSGGCAGCSDAGSATVGSCTSECGVQCLDSGEIMELNPYALIDPPFAQEIRQMLTYALAKSGLNTPGAKSVGDLEKQMQPRTIKEVEMLESQLKSALHEVQRAKDYLKSAK
jgi:hypothetical protein